jgi:predicted butyrate kinase (DUF1464 family)
MDLKPVGLVDLLEVVVAVATVLIVLAAAVAVAGGVGAAAAAATAGLTPFLGLTLLAVEDNLMLLRLVDLLDPVLLFLGGRGMLAHSTRLLES